MAELILAARAAPGEIRVASAGLGALTGHPIDTSAALVLTELGLDPAPHRARQFVPAMAADADLVLTAERAHRDRVIGELPSAFRRVFTMKEFARLAPYAGTGEPREVIRRAADARGSYGPVPRDEDDVPDGYRLPVEPVRAIARQIEATVGAAVAALLRPTPEEVRPRPRPGPGLRPRPASRPLPPG
jgi:protein-tyrosine phosphatase